MPLTESQLVANSGRLNQWQSSRWSLVNWHRHLLYHLISALVPVWTLPVSGEADTHLPQADPKEQPLTSNILDYAKQNNDS